MLLLSWEGHAQTSQPLWQPATGPAGVAAKGTARWFTLDTAQLAARLAPAPLETRPADAVTVELPFPDGTLHRFALTQVPVLAPALAARYPQIRTYAGWSLDDLATMVRLETSPAGLHAQVLTPTGPLSVLADPRAANRYEVRTDTPVDFTCQALPVPGRAQGSLRGPAPVPPAPYGSQLRTLRLALAATGEYTQNFGGGTVAGTLASMATLVNSLNAVYERDLAVRLQLVANNDLLVFTDGTTDPYDNSSANAMLNANQTVVNSAIGVANYDLGHVLGYLGGGYSGVAYVGVVCSANLAASGASTGSSAAYMATVVTHEIGHQLGSGHTFSGDQGNCSGGNRDGNMAFEPGAGNTIMSYDGRCTPDNVGSGIVYFHAGSLSAILPWLTCGTLSATGNQPPSVAVPPSTYVIPRGTPFALAGSGTDPNGDALTYSWEELDRGDPTGLAGAATDPSGPPLFRSFAPVASPVRTFPALPMLVNNMASLGEMLPQVVRSLNFRFTARDNRGGVAGANVTLAVAANGPFRVTEPHAAFTTAQGSHYTVAWNVVGSDQEPVNCPAVQILFSTDGGLTFPTVLLASTPNSGTALVQLPHLNTTFGRVKVQALDNVFFAINIGSITLTAPLPVELTAFTAEVHAATARLAWATASEKNNAGFIIETSSDGVAFHRLGWVAGQGSRPTPSRYQFVDGTLAGYPGPAAYYRLRQLDEDGTEHLSPVRAVAVPMGLSAGLQVWPNPTQGSVTVAGLAPGQLVQVLDALGQVLLTAALPANGPLQLATRLAPGIYMVRGGGQFRRLAVE